MKSMTKLMVVAMILAAALVVAPAAAREVNSSATVYVGEEQLNFSNAAIGSGGFGTDPITQLVHYSDPTAGAIDKIISADGVGNITELTRAAIGTATGSYYVFNSTTTDLKRDNAAGFVNVQYPEVTLGVVLDKPGLKDSIDGKSITREDDLAFKLTNNLNGFPGQNASMNIEVTLPGGGVVTYFGGQYLNQTWVNGTTAEIGSIKLTGAAAGKYSAQAKWPKTADFYDKGFNSNTVTFEVLSKSLAITSDKDSVVRGNSFAVTITGRSLEQYDLYVKTSGSLAANEYPFLVAGQNGVKDLVASGASTAALSSPIDANATIETTAGGTRTVQFNTGSSTKDQTFTIRVEAHGPTNTTVYDEVKVKVEKGAVTITASGTGTYYIGEEITLSGTCTDNDTTVHLFMTGPNLDDPNGVKLETLAAVVNNDTSSFTTTDVKSDDTWSLKWNTGDTVKTKALDAGGYTIYAVSKPLNKAKLSDAQYATTSIQLRSGFISATSSGAVIAKGDDLKLTGVAQGDPDTVAVWIFGKNYQKLADSATVEDDGSFEYELKGSQTKDLAAGQYFVVIQHPMMNKEFDIIEDTANPGSIVGRAGSGLVNPVKIDGLQASDAATALITALDSPNIDDTYVKLTFVVEEPNIWIDAIGDKTAGSKFTITGTTNLAVGDTLNIEVTSAAFKPTTKSEASGFGSVAGTTTVKQGDGANTWSFEVDGASFKPDQYIVKVECIETTTTATATLNVIEAVPTTQATPTKTAATVTTPTATATTQATPTQSPGFGALIALAGLGAVAFLVLRRD